MPIDFKRQCEYKVDYEEIYNVCNERPFLDNDKLQKQYLDMWINQLKDADRVTTQQFREPSIRLELFKEILEAPQIFQLPLIYSGTTVYSHFRVTRCLQALQRSNIDKRYAQKIELSRLICDNSDINWTNPDDEVEIQDEPILLVPLYVGIYYNWLVIDGNHRIADAIKRGKEYIEAYVIGDDDLVENKLFLSQYDCLIYIFQNEIVTMGTYTNRNNVAATRLVSQSYLLTGKTMKL